MTWKRINSTSWGPKDTTFSCSSVRKFITRWPVHLRPGGWHLHPHHQSELRLIWNWYSLSKYKMKSIIHQWPNGYESLVHHHRGIQNKFKRRTMIQREHETSSHSVMFFNSVESSTWKFGPHRYLSDIVVDIFVIMAPFSPWHLWKSPSKAKVLYLIASKKAPRKPRVIWWVSKCACFHCTISQVYFWWIDANFRRNSIYFIYNVWKKLLGFQNGFWSIFVVKQVCFENEYCTNLL